MTVAYFDASALVKLLLYEDGSDEAELLWDAATGVFASRLVTVEVVSALAAASRRGRIDDVALRQASERWGSDRVGIEPVELTDDLALAAAELATRYPLSGADAVHLASALALADADPVVATWDARLHAAARDEGLATLPARL